VWPVVFLVCVCRPDMNCALLKRVAQSEREAHGNV